MMLKSLCRSSTVSTTVLLRRGRRIAPVYLEANYAQLAQHSQCILIAPQLHYFPVTDTDEIHPRQYDLFASRGNAAISTCMGSPDSKAKGNDSTFTNDLFDAVRDIRK